MKKILPILFIFTILTLRAFSNGGCAFTYQVDSINPLQVWFVYAGWNGPQTYNYDFGDSSGTSTQQDCNYTYSSPGNYMVILNTLDTNGIPCSYNLLVTVGGSTSCSFIHSGGGPAPTVVSFSNTSVRSFVNFYWDFGDGDSSLTQNAAHTYTTPGVYSVCLTTTDTSGLPCTTCQNITITAVCDAAFQYASVGLTTYFVENSIPTNIPGMTYQWNFGDGSSPTNSTRYPVHVYPVAGNFIACLFITDNVTCFDSICDSIVVDTIPPSGCNANFLFTELQPYSIAIINNSYGSSPTFLWNFGDGDTSNLAYPNHTYNSTGSYRICLSLTDSTGCSSNFCDSLNVDSLGNITSKALTGFTVTVIAPADLTLSTPQIENSKISVYPNPAQEFIIVNVQDAGGANNYSLRSFTGSILRTGHINSGKNVVDVSQLSGGMYFFEIRNGMGERKCWKIIKE